MIVGADIDKHAAQFPDRLAIVCGAEELRWRECAGIVNRISNWITARTAPGQSVALILPNCIALPVLALGIARAGRTAQIMDPAWPAAMTVEVLAQISPALVIAETPVAGISADIVFEMLQCSTQELVNMLANQSSAFAPGANPENAFYTGFTSGSTGIPKGFTRSHQSWTESFDAEASEFGIGSEDVFLAPGSLTHSLFFYAALRSLHVGATVVLMPSFRPDFVVHAANHHAATFLYAVPAQLKMIASATRVDNSLPASHMRLIVSSGSKWDKAGRQDLRISFPNAQFAEFYGASELSFVSVAKESESAPAGSVGRAFSGVEIKILDEEGNAVAVGGVGQIFVRSKMVFDGYENETAGASLQHSDGCVSIGDMGYVDESGFLFLTGRRDRMIVTAGKNLFPEEVESVLQMHPAISEVAVLPAVDTMRGARLVCILHTASKKLLPRADVIKFAREHLPLYKIPRRYFILEKWPRTASGKTDFNTLQNMLVANDLQLRLVT